MNHQVVVILKKKRTNEYEEIYHFVIIYHLIVWDI
jgi:hypothetical protein